ncbi:MAG: GIY-YIG nuclease family protein [Candidatus Omnitrophota bacterium]
MWYIYILLCSDRSFYVGSSEDIHSRVQQHNEGRGAKYTKHRRPVELIYYEELSSKKSAELREKEIKRYSRKNKENLALYGTGKRFPSSRNQEKRETRDFAQ